MRRANIAGYTVALLLTCLDVGQAWGGDDDEYKWKSLAGLRGVAVVVEKIPEESQRAGLAEATLQTDVELKLRQAGIRVLSGTERLSSPGSPYLYVNVNVFHNSIGLVAYSIRVSLEQQVRLVRDPRVEVFATTWNTGGVGTVGVSNLSTIRGPVRDFVDQFINGYLATNPKAVPKQ